MAVCVRQLGTYVRSVSLGSLSCWVSGELEAWELVGRFALIWASFLSCSLLTCGTVWMIMWMSAQFLAQTPFPWCPPPALGSPPVCLQSAVCCEGEAGNSLGSAVTVVQSRKPSWRRRDRQGLFVRILYIDFWRKERGLRNDFSIEILWNALHNRTKSGKEKGL